MFGSCARVVKCPSVIVTHALAWTRLAETTLTCHAAIVDCADTLID